MIRKLLCIGFLVLMLANPVLGAVKLDNITVQNGVNEVQKTDRDKLKRVIDVMQRRGLLRYDATVDKYRLIL